VSHTDNDNDQAPHEGTGDTTSAFRADFLGELDASRRGWVTSKGCRAARPCLS